MALVVSSTTAVPAAELDAMRDLKASIDPINRLNWFSTPDACTGSLNQWVSVISTNDSITGIALPYYGMEGTLPNSIGNLRNLTRLSISGNRLSGTLPQSLLQTQLSELRMDGNSFSSPLPTTFSECQR
jgi:Leucine-rich repeat (LRR) protein